MLGEVIANYDGHQQNSEAGRLRVLFEEAIGAPHPQRNEILRLLSRNPLMARVLEERLLKEAA